jgi:hypothetical protein
MLSKADLEALAAVRLADAAFLQQVGRSSSAYYLAGYAVELALKACIAKAFQPNVIPDKAFLTGIYTHSLEQLFGLAGLAQQFKAECTADPQLAAAWGVASKWTEESRYELWDCISASNLLGAIGDPNHGVFQWVKKHW